MPSFLDDELLWCPDNDERMVDLSCLQDTVTNHQSMEDAPPSPNDAGPGSLAPGVPQEGDLQGDADDLLKQLGETAFLDNFFTDLASGIVNAAGCADIEIKQEENNNVPSTQLGIQTPLFSNQHSNTLMQLQNGHINTNNNNNHCQQRLQTLQNTLRNTFQYPNNNGLKYNNIASANPLLAEKLAATSNGIKQEPLSNDYVDSSLGYDSAPVMQRIGDIKEPHDPGDKGMF